MRYQQILEIRNALVTLGDGKLPIAYEIARNIRLCEAIIKDTEEVTRTLYEGYADKTLEGTPRVYEENGKQVLKISDPKLAEECRKELLKAEMEDHDIQFVKIKGSALSGAAVSATVILPLLDVVIVGD